MSVSISFFKTLKSNAEVVPIDDLYDLVAGSKNTLNNLYQTSKGISNNLAQKSDAAPDLVKNYETITAKIEDTLHEVNEIYNDVNDLAADAGAEIKWRHSVR